MKKRTMIALPLAVSMLGLLLSGCGKKIDVNQFATTAAAPAATQAAGGAAGAIHRLIKTEEGGEKS